MQYKKAEDLFPQEIMTLIQQYVDGEYIYIPRKPGKKKAWGEKNKARDELARRNQMIYKEYQAGSRKHLLAEKYYLSEKSIERIILQEKNNQMVL